MVKKVGKTVYIYPENRAKLMQKIKDLINKNT